jgi:hypothetical protein
MCACRERSSARETRWCSDGYLSAYADAELLSNPHLGRLLVKVAMSKPHIEYVNSALADWHGSILSLMKAKKEVANDKE